MLASATQHPLLDDSADIIVTDPPYYAAIPYADLSDFFFSWFRRSITGHHAELFRSTLVPKDNELVSLAHRAAMYRYKDNAWFEQQMKLACSEGRRVTIPAGLGVWVFANKETPAWEAMLSALISAGWIVTASWPIDTESGNRLRAKDSAALASSVHIVCRPRENIDGTIRIGDVGDWRDVLDELPERIRKWMRRLKNENVVGADAIFACLGPALEIFSRYSRVEKSSGDEVSLREYLEQVWATVSNEAVKMIFEGGEAESLEPDARLTTMWLWTLGAARSDEPTDEGEEAEVEEDEEGEAKGAKKKTVGFILEYDAARMIAQGLGIHLAKSEEIVRVKGESARLLSVAERAGYLFGKGAVETPSTGPARKKNEQLNLGLSEGGHLGKSAAPSDRFGNLQVGRPGITVLDRLHQAMLLFGASRGEALRAFLVDDGHGRDSRLWRLADSLAALYPRNTEESRWVQGVLSRKKALGL